MDASKLKTQIVNLGLAVDVCQESLSLGNTLEEIWDISSERAQLEALCGAMSPPCESNIASSCAGHRMRMSCG